jgi:hypothetical protein
VADVSPLVWSSEVSLQFVGELGLESTSSNSAFFFLLNDTPQLLARFANVLLAVRACFAGWISLLEPAETPARGDGLGMW